jgi:hypothetical protein
VSPAVVLVQPPHAKACEPTPGLLALAGHLRRRGIGVRLADANLEVQEALLSGTALASSAEALSAEGASGAWVVSGRRVSRRIEAAKAALRNPGTYKDPRAYRSAADTLAEAFRLLSRARSFRISASDLDCPTLSPLSTRDLLRVACEPGLLPIAPELADTVPGILADAPSLIGISAVYLSQALPAFALAGLLRHAGYRGTLVLGGGLVTSWAPGLGPRSELFRIWDALVAGPGEEALEALVAGHSRASSLLQSAAPVVCFDPDPAGLSWDRYFGPGPILPLAASRGCYWKRCAFCPDTAQDAVPFRLGDPRALAETILRARDDHGFRHVHLTDDAVPPRSLRALARALRGQGISWYGFARLERQFLDPGFAEELALGGCAMLQLGVETASQRLLDLLGKGTRAGDAEVVLTNLTAAGIRTYVYLLFGVPSETEEEALGTVEWAAGNAGRISFLNLALMNLPRGAAPAKTAGTAGTAAGSWPAPAPTPRSAPSSPARRPASPRTMRHSWRFFPPPLEGGGEMPCFAPFLDSLSSR